MDQTPPPVPQPETPFPRMSLFARLLNVFAVPGHVFEDVKTAPHAMSNWLVPLVIATLVGIASVLTIARPNVIQELRENQKTVNEQQVKAGKIQQADADKLTKMMDWICQPAVVKVGGTIGALGISTLRILWWAFALWWLGRVFLKVRFSFLKALEVSGLATMISVLAMTAALLLTVDFNEPGRGVTLAQLEAKEKMPVRVVLANVFSIWFVGVLASGLARLSGARFTRAMMLVLGCWIAVQVLLGLFAVGAMGLMR